MCWLLLFLLGNQCTTVFIILKIVLLRGIESFFDMLLFNVTFEILAHKTLFTSTLNCNCNFCKTAWLSGCKKPNHIDRYMETWNMALLYGMGCVLVLWYHAMNSYNFNSLQYGFWRKYVKLFELAFCHMLFTRI